MKPGADGEEEPLLAFVGWWATRIWGLHLEHRAHPIAVYREMNASGLSAGQLRGGIRQAVRDCVSSAADLPLSKIEEIDHELRAANLRTLTSLRAEFTRNLAGVLKRGRLRSEEDYYFAVNVIEDGAISMTAEDRRALAELVAFWEASSSAGESSA